jgi:hypothetical protein
LPFVKSAYALPEASFEEEWIVDWISCDQADAAILPDQAFMMDYLRKRTGTA